MLLIYMYIAWLIAASTAYQYNMYDTDTKHQDGYCLLYYVRDNLVSYYEPYVLAHQIIPYCLRSLKDDILPESFNFTNTMGSQFTFAQLREKNISSLLLLSWSASIDLAERYEVYLNNVSYSTPISSSASEEETLFYNCTLPWFGPLCRFAFDLPVHESLDIMVSQSFRMKQNIKAGYEMICYRYLNCNTSLLCLDWREICDGKIDCSDGSDEFHCWELEINECAQDEYRCHNGQCIPAEFLADVSLNPDCLDQTDERANRVKPSPCFQDPAFRCEEHICRPGTVDFPCGDGECTDGIATCRNGRNSALFDDLCSRSLTCFFNYYDTDTDDWCQTFCTDNDCVEVNCPSFYQFPTGYTVFGHVRLIFNSETIKNRTSMTLQSYICYNEKLCMDFLRPTTFLNNLTCRHSHELGISAENVYNSLSQQIENVKNRFRGCLILSLNELVSCNHSTMYQCENSTKCISKHRLLDGIRDCPFHDDESFNQSCSLSDTHHRFICAVNNSKRCFAWLVVQDGKSDCKYIEDERIDDLKVTTSHIYFQTICDGKRELQPILIDGRNETDETECEYWPCNNTYSRCDDFWLCKNGADEINCAPSTCPRFEHSCIFPNDTSKVSCLPIERAGDGIVDCLAATDERNHCNYLTLESHRYRFRCWNDTRCIYGSQLCTSLEECPYGDDKKICPNNLLIWTTVCAAPLFSETEIGRFLCHFMKSIDRPRKVYLKLSNIPTSLTLSTTETTLPALFFHEYHRSILTNTILNISDTDANRCNRGLPIFTRMNADSFEFGCLCSPSYYGEKCQYQNQRVSLTIQLRAVSDWRHLFTVIIMLVDNEGNIESYDHIEYLPIRDCDTKFNVYLLYATRPKNRSKKYSVRIEICSRLTFNYRGSWTFSLQFPFLPVHRLPVLLRIPYSDIESHHGCTPPCIHGQCFHYVNDWDVTFCRCESGWSGPQCTNKYICNCTPNALCIANSICLCPFGRFGPRCSLQQSSCFPESCQHNGQCVPRDERYISTGLNRTTCICSKEYWGDRCEQQQTRIEISFDNTLNIPLSLLIHFITVRNRAEHIRTTTMKKIALDQNSLTLYTSVTFNIAFAEMFHSYYLIILREQLIVSADISTQITPTYRCASLDELFNSTFVSQHLLKRIKHYHIPCQKRLDLICFYDAVHFCLCDLSRNANCFEFDHNMTYNCRGYNFCENGGQCFQDDKKCPTSAICVCDQCYYGSKCQFSTKGSTLSLDIILGYRIHSNLGINQQSNAVKGIIALTIIMLCISLISNLFSILTFRTKATRNVGCGIYLLASSITSVITMSVFTIKFWVLLTTQMNLINNRLLLNVQCIMIDFFLRILLSASDWLTACVAIERTVTVLKGINFPKSKSTWIAKRMVFIVLLFTICTHIHDPIHRQLVDDEEEQRTWCITKYSTSLQIFDWIVNIIHFSVPFLINCISALIIIVTTTRVRSVARGKESYKKLLREQFQHHKHLLISPGILVILSFPRLFISFLSGCMKSTRNFWLYLIGYFISFIPSMLIFVVFVLPSETYKTEFNKSIKRFWHY